MGGLTVRPDLAHRWDLAPQEAIALQRRLAERVRREPDLGEVRRVAGVDASYRNQTAVGAVVVLDYPTLTVVDYVVARCPVTYPYVPGLLSFREAPAVLQALAQIKVVPDLLIFDGHGIAHPRRLGLASHIGVLLDVPSIGCAKRRLCGTYEMPGTEAGSVSPLYDKDTHEIIGAVVRTRTDVRPVFVSVGHRVDLDTAIHYVLTCCRGRRLPEPTRWADKIAGGLRPALEGLGSQDGSTKNVASAQTGGSNEGD